MNYIWEHIEHSLDSFRSSFTQHAQALTNSDVAPALYLARLKHNLIEPLQGSGLMADIRRFFYAVNWNQYWILSLLTFHVGTFLVILLVKKRSSLLTVLLITLILLAASSEHVNYLGDLYWDKFSVANYFDSHGFFILIVYAIPIICNASLILIILLTQVAQLLVRAKRLELQTGAQQKSKQKLH
ncbi:hypothetical protein K493DRAFT_310356 [Basidiobolus meristosporus CBS 931.73]|uniref:Uncharacterized protein n=1 Tax=Basidiobolus meristosporus CBS 931.73 TaxID=1314790 RepID=A0A1Y1Z9K0_9FUNG|nr:hypothetical protein K493DRAFT_310356 [Basidiobolus meristosporus CBS 931.73]|eukprot:ORY06948.1 hypothetical protein K493DRAFT_310356 [Basidiobolus meristosporus CBS 931.73]